MYNEFEDEIWESLLKAAVMENSLNEIKGYSTEQKINSMILPEPYDLRMRKIIRCCRYHENAETSLRYGKKAASIVLLIMGISFAALLSFEEVRAAYQNVIIHIYMRNIYSLILFQIIQTLLEI